MSIWPNKSAAASIFSFCMCATLFMLVSACSKDKPSENGKGAGSESSGGKNHEAASPFSYPKEPPLVDLQGLKEKIQQYSGHVVLVDFWATYCAPCIKAFPGLVKLQKRLGPSGLQVLAVNRDRPENWQKAVKVLKEKNANFPCVILEDASSNAAVEYFGEKWRSELPARFLIDRSGKVVEEFLYDSSKEDIEKVAKKLLNEGQ